jgi:hypothetical protein
MKKRQPQETQRGSSKRSPMKKEATTINTKGLIKKTSDEKRGNPQKMQAGSLKRHLMKKRQPQEKRAKRSQKCFQAWRNRTKMALRSATAHIQKV